MACVPGASNIMKVSNVVAKYEVRWVSSLWWILSTINFQPGVFGRSSRSSPTIGPLRVGLMSFEITGRHDKWIYNQVLLSDNVLEGVWLLGTPAATVLSLMRWPSHAKWTGMPSGFLDISESKTAFLSHSGVSCNISILSIILEKKRDSGFPWGRVLNAILWHARR